MSTSASVRPTFAEASRALLRETVLDAVGELLSDRVWAEVTMAQVAAQAGVSRQTLYNAFGTRQELAQAYVIREADRFLVAVQEAVRADGHDPRAAVASALEIFLSAAATHPLVRAIASAEEGDQLLALVTTRGGPVLDRVTEGLAAVIAENWPRLARAETKLVADTLVRLAISHAALPSGSPKQTAASVARILGPYMDQLLESS
jgi:AcrR family transcriptional regulator